jgi:hypothetical protein
MEMEIVMKVTKILALFACFFIGNSYGGGKVKRTPYATIKNRILKLENRAEDLENRFNKIDIRLKNKTETPKTNLDMTSMDGGSSYETDQDDMIEYFEWPESDDEE